MGHDVLMYCCHVRHWMCVALVNEPTLLHNMSVLLLLVDP